ncbi:spermidine/putrescine ABC transporter substrate-binding protein [Trinickia symbiotica]|uniref:Spermidine/putrescine ABC transporter substrate-binding protein n=1 Tax=Trinickia symbiotica TaxID=863227 RepID=A0A2T3XR93_9BURK|nr:ABC transporter substrate-binding protein [Trinickia symbiotica]PTB19049.1 spermidine/putrescine ABC transporter substrate-binding protein [Trinickia symbiotica]
MKVGVLALILGLAVAGQASAQKTLTVVSWGGDDTKLQQEVFYIPFEKETGIRINSVDYSGGNAQVRAQVESGAVSWDVVDGETSLALKGCAEGLLVDISKWPLPPAPDGTPAKDDYLPGALVDCGVGWTAWTVAFGYQNNLPVKPQNIADVFDTKKIPGKRGFSKSPLYVLEFALEADGVSPHDVYKVLRTKEGVDRAFAKLDTIKKDIVWWDSWSQGMQLLADKEVVIGMSASGRLRTAKTQRHLPIDILWNGQIVQTDAFTVVKGTRKEEYARKFIEYISRPDVEKRVYVPTAQYKPATDSLRPNVFPVRRSAMKAVDYDPTDAPVIKSLLGAEAGSSTSVFDDGTFWSKYSDELNIRFNAWLQK